MKHLRDRLVIVFGGLVLVVMAVITINDEVHYTRLLATVEKQRLALGGKVMAARLSTRIDNEAQRLFDIEAADARALAVGAAPPPLPSGEGRDLLLQLDGAGHPIDPLPNGSAVQALIRFAAPVTVRREDLVVLDDSLYIVSVLPMKGRDHRLVIARALDEDVRWLATETAAHGGAEDGVLALVNRAEVLDVCAATNRSSAETLRDVRQVLAGLLSDPRLTGLTEGATVADVFSITAAGQEWLAVPTLIVTRTPDDSDAWFVYMRPRAAVFRPVREQRNRLLGIGSAAVVAVLVFALFMSGRITRPLEHLVGKMRAVSRGDLEQCAEVEGRDEIAQLSATFNHMTEGLRQKELLKRYVPVQAREMIETDRTARVVLGGRRVRITALFSDIRGFTAMSERLEAEAVVTLLNAYLDAMIGVIHRHHGDVIDYIGDGIFAVFHDGETRGAARAALAALDMQEALERLRAQSSVAHIEGLRMGIGIHTGPAVEGNIGTEARLKFGVVGDTVNVASRIQDRSRDGRHTCILMSEAAQTESGEAVETAFFGDERFKGKSEPMPIWEVVRLRVGAVSAPASSQG